MNSEDHDTLEAAVLAAGLDDDLSGAGPFTVFAPTDAAFGALPAGTLETLLADPTGELANILLYHVVGSKALSTDLSDGQMIETLLGKKVEVSISDGKVYINEAMVSVADIAADNGVVHVIDAVLLPPITSINSNKSTLNVRLYPNPATDQLIVEVPNPSGEVLVQIVSMNGAVLKSKAFTGDQSNLELNGLAPGVYILQVQLGDQQAMERLIIN